MVSSPQRIPTTTPQGLMKNNKPHIKRIIIETIAAIARINRWVRITLILSLSGIESLEIDFSEMANNLKIG